MNAAALDHPSPLDHSGPWTEDEYLAMPETPGPRVELLDGGLLVTPGPTMDHQQVARRLANLLEAVVPEDLEVLVEVNIRVASSRILIPDVVVMKRSSDRLVGSAADVLLVSEVVSPWSVTTDRVLKPQLYAAAGIGWYVRVELRTVESPEVIAYRLSSDGYVEHGRARPGQTLRLPEPVEVEVDPGALLRHGAGDPGGE